MKVCPLCLSDKQKVKESIQTAELMRLYKSRRNIDVSKYFDGHQSIDTMECQKCNLIYYSPSILGAGDFYDELQKDINYYITDKEEYSIAATHIKKNDRVLEIGGGIGSFTKYLTTKNYVGLEFSEKAIQKAKNEGINMINETLEEHSNNHELEYDVVCYFQVLEHISEPHEFISLSLKTLKKGGKLIFAVPSEDSYVGSVVNDYLNAPPHHATRWTDNTVNQISSIFGLKKIAVIHDTINRVHQPFYYRTIIYNWLRKILGAKKSKFDTSLFSNLLYAVAYVVSPICRIFLKKNSNKIMGHSVVGIFEKL